ncbi:MAG TPA: cytochrome c oxidase subunit II [Anaeromyxobacter sp.]
MTGAGALARVLRGAGPGLMPSPASSAAEGVDRVFAFIFWVSAFFLALILLLTVVFVLRYRRRASRPDPEPSPSHDTRLELLWTIVPLVLVLVMFAMSTRTYLRMTSAQPGSSPLTVQVTARKWSWWFDHPGGKGAAELHLVAGRPAELVMSSTDVIHSLYVPDFRLKQDAVPGRFTRMTFTPTAAGRFPILCAEYCGTDHSRMAAVVVVHADQASFDAWAREGVAPDGSLVELGKHVFLQRGCIACHSLDGSRRVGPSVKGLWRKMERLADGAAVLVDEDYLRESVLKPGAKVVAGFPNAMPPIPLEERELKAVIAYIQSLAEGK